jgi:hypothetical protein
MEKLTRDWFSYHKGDVKRKEEKWIVFQTNEFWGERHKEEYFNVWNVYWDKYRFKYYKTDFQALKLDFCLLINLFIKVGVTELSLGLGGTKVSKTECVWFQTFDNLQETDMKLDEPKYCLASTAVYTHSLPLLCMRNCHSLWGSKYQVSPSWWWIPSFLQLRERKLWPTCGLSKIKGGFRMEGRPFEEVLLSR